MGKFANTTKKNKRTRHLTKKNTLGPSPPPAFGFAAVDHSATYEAALAGRHGSQIEKAWDEGLGRDDKVYDPFEDPRTAKGFIAFEDLAYDDDDDDDDDEDDYEDDIEEGEIIDSDDDILTDEGDFEVNSGELEEDDSEEERTGAWRELLKTYNKAGFPIRPNSEIAALRAGFPSGGLFAVIEISGTQEKVCVDDVVIMNRIRPVSDWAVGSTHTLSGDDVLLVGSTHLTLVGLPGVKGAEVDVMVEEITKDKKVIVFKKRRRKNSRRKRGFRRDVTMLRILDIRFPKDYAKNDHKARIF